MATTISQGSSSDITVSGGQCILLESLPTSRATMEAVSGVEGSQYRKIYTNNHSGRKLYGPFSPGGTVKVGAAVGSVDYTVGSSETFDDGNGFVGSFGAVGAGSGDALLANPLSQFAATTSAQLAGVISDETGSGALVFANSPTLVTPTIGAATATTINKVAITEPATSATLAIANDKTLTASNTLTLAGTDATTMTFPSTSQTIAGLSATQTLTNKTISGSSNTLTNLPAANISGVIPIANLATGVPTGTKFIRDDGTLVVPTGSGDVAKVGTPVDNQVGVWTGNGTIEGDAALTFNTTTDTLAVGASGKFAFGAVNILDDTTGTTTLSNIDALDATTEATIEAAIDTLANLTSVQGHTVTLTGALVRSGAHSLTLTTTGTTSVTLPESGTLLASNSPATLSTATNLVRATHGNRLLVCDTAATHTVEDDTTGAWVAGDVLYGINTSAGNVILQGDGTATVTAETGHTLTIAAGQSWSLSRTGANAWRGGALDADLMTIAGLVDPNADRLMFWDDSAGAWAFLTAGSGLSISGTTITTTAASLIGHKAVTIGWAATPGNGSLLQIGSPVAAQIDGGTAGAVTSSFNTDQGFSRVAFTSAVAAANRSAGFHGASSFFAPSADVQCQPLAFRGWFAAADAITSCRMWMGLTGVTTHDPAVDPSTYVNCVGVGKDAADTNLSFMHNDSDLTCTKVALGASFPGDTNALDGYELTLKWTTNTSCEWTVTNTSTGATQSGTAATNLPSNIELRHRVFRNSAANASTVVCHIGHQMFGALSGL